MISEDSSKNVSAIYSFLALCMNYPDKSWMSGEYFNAYYELLSNLGAIEELEELKKHIENSNDFLEDIQVEHTHLFINGVPHVVAPPYASIYMDKSLQGVFAGDTLAFYREKGFEMANDSDLPDYIVHELEFLSLLAKDNDAEGEALFLHKFFRPWFKQFHNKVIREAEHPFYRTTVKLIDFFTKEED